MRVQNDKRWLIVGIRSSTQRRERRHVYAFDVGLWNTVLCSGSVKCICGSINGNLVRKIWRSRRVWSAFYGWQLMIADHDDVFCYDSSILPTMNKSSRNLVPDIKIAVHPRHWAPLSVVSTMVSVWHSRTLEGSVLDLFPLKFGNAPQTSPWFLPLSSGIWNRQSCHRLVSESL